MKVYLDNAATSYPKPERVTYAVMNYMMNIGSNPGRGGYSLALEGDRIVYRCREALMNLFNFDKVENIIFTPNITTSLNLLIKSTIKDGWHVITSSMDHNSVLRPLSALAKRGKIELDIINSSKEGIISIDELKKHIKCNTKMIVLSHASNVVGTIQPLEQIGAICRQNNIYFIIDSAQTAGSIKVDFKKLNCNALAFTGHKSLLGPQGTGGFLIDDALNNEAVSFYEGGTGSLSNSIEQPDFLPDKFESGTLNAPGIAGLLEGIHFIEETGISSINEQEEYLTQKFIDGLMNIDSIYVYGFHDSSLRTSVISINSSKISNSELGFLLDTEFGIMARTGLHCAPLAHTSLGTFSNGTIRFGIGPFNNITDINYTLRSINSIIKRM